MGSRLVLTDSGGIQEESTVLDIPCLTMRNNTERPITIERGTNTLVGMNKKKIMLEVKKILDGKYKHAKKIPFWDGNAAERIVEVIKRGY
jgi:UDP-N-acetylglucosamine 2-epimerase (non-hydrolysing)